MTRARWVRRGLTVLLAALVLVLLARAIAPWNPLFQETLSPRTILGIGTWGKFLYLLVGAVVSTLLVKKFEPGTPSGTAWRLLSAGLVCVFLGQACIAFYQFGLGMNELPFPSVADFFFVVSYPLVIAALLMFLRAYSASGLPIGSRAEWIWTATAIAAFCMLLLMWGWPMFKKLFIAPEDPLAAFLNVLYPVLDCLLLIPTVLLIRISLRFRGGAVWKVWATLLVGFLFLCAADILFAYFFQLNWVELTDLVDATFLLSYGFLGLGVLYQRDLLA